MYPSAEPKRIWYDTDFLQSSGAMGSPLTLTAAYCYMFFFEQDIITTMYDNNGL
jgi:hypothetical protein